MQPQDMWFPVYVESNKVLSGPSMCLLWGGMYMTVIMIEENIPGHNVGELTLLLYPIVPPDCM